VTTPHLLPVGVPEPQRRRRTGHCGRLDPTRVGLLERSRIDVVEPLAAAPLDRHQTGLDQHPEVLHDGESGGREALSQ
jgi:hypothetical protein